MHFDPINYYAVTWTWEISRTHAGHVNDRVSYTSRIPRASVTDGLGLIVAVILVTFSWDIFRIYYVVNDGCT